MIKIESKLIIIRGNSGSGKTTIANNLQHHFGDATLLVSQDIVRRDMLNVRDRKGNLSLDLIRQITEYGKGRCEFVILEGILSQHRYGDMLEKLIEFYDGNAYTYYFDLSFEQTLERHHTRSKTKEFGEDSLRAWWTEKDYLGVSGETMLTNNMTQNDSMNVILNQLQD